MSKDSNVKILPLDPDPHPGRALGFTALLTVAVGNVFGASVYSLQAPASGLTGRSAWLAFAVACIIGFITVFPYLMICGAVSLKGGDFTTVDLGLGKMAGGLFSWCFILMCIGPAIAVSAIIGYVTTLWPGAPGKLIAIAVTVLIFILNICPIKAVSKAQNYMFYILCASTLVYIIYGLFHINADAFDFSAPNYFSGGMKGFISASTTFCATTSFYVQISALGGQSQNPRKHMPKSMLITALIILILYPLMTLVNVNTLPWEATVGKPMVATARDLMPTALFVFFIICGPFLAVTTTLNAGFMALARPFDAAAEKGWLPKVLTKKNKAGAPVGTMILLLLVSVIPVILTDNIMILANATVMVQNIIKLITLAAAWCIPAKFPEFWKTGYFRKLPMWAFYVIMTICTAVQLAMIISAMTNLAAWQVILGVGLIVLMCVIALIWYKFKKDSIQVDVDYESMS